MLLGFGDETRKREPERPRDPLSHVQAGVSLSPLDEADVGVVDVGALSQGLLREAIA